MDWQIKISVSVSTHKTCEETQRFCSRWREREQVPERIAVTEVVRHEDT